eukprot:908865-Pelagomonas_calceolata.AAC.5
MLGVMHAVIKIEASLLLFKAGIQLLSTGRQVYQSVSPSLSWSDGMHLQVCRSSPPHTLVVVTTACADTALHQFPAHAHLHPSGKLHRACACVRAGPSLGHPVEHGS